jgi:hypothetical protein
MYKQTIRNQIFIALIAGFLCTSCGIFKTHHKNKLIDFEQNVLTNASLKLDGYYFTELELEYDQEAPLYIDDYIAKTGVNKIKYLSVFFIYEDGFIVNVGGVNGISHYYCADKEDYKNTYESAHETIALMLNSQNSFDKRIKRSCGFSPNDISNKGLVQIDDDAIKIQLYRIEMQNPTKDSFNSAYLYETNGIITSDTSFIIKSETEFRTNTTTPESAVFQFRQTKQKPNIENYFKKHKKRFN